MLGFYKKSNCRLSNNCQQGNGILEVDCDKYVRIEQLAIDRRFANKNGFELITIGNKVRRRFLGVGERSEFRPVCIASLLRWPTRGRHRSRNPAPIVARDRWELDRSLSALGCIVCPQFEGAQIGRPMRFQEFRDSVGFIVQRCFAVQ